MRIINAMRLKNGDLGFELNHDPDLDEQQEFYAWVRQHKIDDYIGLVEHTWSGAYVIDGHEHVIVLIRKNAPDHVETLCRLRWV